MKADRIEPVYVDFIPSEMEEGKLYISERYRTASHLCCCGCENKVVTPLKEGAWHISKVGSAVTLRPSVGSWNLECRSHYLITKNQVEWAGRWTDEQAEAGKARDRAARQAYFDKRARRSIWQKAWDWLLGLFR